MSLIAVGDLVPIMTSPIASPPDKDCLSRAHRHLIHQEMIVGVVILLFIDCLNYHCQLFPFLLVLNHNNLHNEQPGDA